MNDDGNFADNGTVMLTAIAQAYDEQNYAICQIRVAMVQMDSASQQNAAFVQESSAAASAM